LLRKELQLNLSFYGITALFLSRRQHINAAFPEGTPSEEKPTTIIH